MVPSASGSASASYTSRCCSTSESPSKRGLATETWKWSPPPVRASTESSSTGNAPRSSSSTRVRASMGKVLEQVGAREHAGRLASRRDDDCGAPAAERREDLVDCLVRLDRGQRRLHRRRDLLAQRVRVPEDEVEEPTLLQRADDVGE